MKTDKTSKTLSISIILILFTFIASCNNDNDMPNDPNDAVTLNMLDEENGKTRLGVSDVYIDKANNFHTYSSFIADGGSAYGIGVNITPKLDNLVYEVAVTVGHVYQVFDYRTVYIFPSGVRAIMLGEAYYKFYVVSPITKDNKSVGSVIKYVSAYPDKKGLPEYGYKLGKVSIEGESVSMELPKSAECVWNRRDMLEMFDISTDNGKLKMTLKQTPIDYYTVRDEYEIYVRIGDTYTVVCVAIVPF